MTAVVTGCRHLSRCLVARYPGAAGNDADGFPWCTCQGAAPMLLDLFCGGGGTTRGYQLAGFDVTGADHADHSRAMKKAGLEFVQADWEVALAVYGRLADVIAASPPCQHYSRASACRPGLAKRYPDLIGPVREALTATGKPYIIENVPGAARWLNNPVRLCGTSFGRVTDFPPHGLVELRRERLFESNVALDGADCDHRHTALRVFGHGRPGNSQLRGPGYARAAREVTGISWMTRDELAEAVPPVFTEYIGTQVLAGLPGGHS